MVRCLPPKRRASSLLFGWLRAWYRVEIYGGYGGLNSHASLLNTRISVPKLYSLAPSQHRTRQFIFDNSHTGVVVKTEHGNDMPASIRLNLIDYLIDRNIYFQPKLVRTALSSGDPAW